MTGASISLSTPAVVLPVGNSEIVEDDITGFLAEAPTVSSVANALERFWAKRATLEEMGKAGARKIRQLVPPDPVRDFTEKLKTFLQ